MYLKYRRFLEFTCTHAFQSRCESFHLKITSPEFPKKAELPESVPCCRPLRCSCSRSSQRPLARQRGSTSCQGYRLSKSNENLSTLSSSPRRNSRGRWKYKATSSPEQVFRMIDDITPSCHSPVARLYSP